MSVEGRDAFAAVGVGAETPVLDARRPHKARVEAMGGSAIVAHPQAAASAPGTGGVTVGARLRPSQVPVTQPGDAVERDADRLADLIAPSPNVARGGRRSPVAYAPSAVWAAVDSPGRPLTGDERPAAFGIDWAGVRIHTGNSAAESARALDAAAYSVGDNIVLAGGYDGRSAEGRRVLAHELAHVVQQRSHPDRVVVHRQGAHNPAGPEEGPPSGMAAKEGGSPVGGPAAKPLKELLRLDQTVPVKGLAAQQPNYVDRAVEHIESAPLGPDITLIPRAGVGSGQGVSVLKGDFFIGQDPLVGFAMEQNQVYRSREVAEAVVAELNRMSPGMSNYAYYLRDGLIFPTVLSATTIPNLMKAVRAKHEQDLQGLKATGDLAEALLWWYVGARFPVKVSSGVGLKGAAAAKVAFNAAKIADELAASTKTIVNAGERMLAAGRQLSAMQGLTAVQKVDVMLEFFNRIGFAISKAGVVDDGARLIMYSEDSRYAFAFLKDTAEILYGKFDPKGLEYIWRALK